MSYPNALPSFTTKINKNASGWYVPVDAVVIPTAAPYETYLDHVPRDVATTTIADYTYTAGVPTAGKYNLDLIYGKVTFSAGNAPATKNATYYSLGDDIMAEHVNDIQDNIVAVDTELGTDPAGSYDTVKERLDELDITVAASGIDGDRLTDNTVRSGALMADIKGASWEATRDVLTDITAHKIDLLDAHQAIAIGAIDPGATLVATVQDHIDTIGNGSATTTNAHGQVLSDFNAGTGIISGTARFQTISSNTLLFKEAYASGNMLPVTADLASASGQHDVGTQSTPWASGNFNVIQAASGSFTTVLSTVGLKSGNIIPQIAASGKYDVGTAMNPWASGSFATLQSTSYKTGNSLGVSGEFTASGVGYTRLTMRVENGLIVKIY